MSQCRDLKKYEKKIKAYTFYHSGITLVALVVTIIVLLILV